GRRRSGDERTRSVRADRARRTVPGARFVLASGDSDEATSMNRRLLLYVLILSISLNLGVLAAVGYRALGSANAPGSDEAFAGLVSYLGLREEQQRHWREA